MQIAKYQDASGNARIATVKDNQFVPLVASERLATLSDILAADDPIQAAESLEQEAALPISGDITFLPPIDAQEVWAAGVTYKRSQTARMEESEAAASCYDRVYQADRPELFFKATPHRVAGHLQPLRIRQDATWNVPEPEITLVLSPAMKIVGLTVGNDMSSRDIEGENPLYLPQAKCYRQCAGLGPWITLYRELPPAEEIGVHLRIERQGQVVFHGDTGATEMARSFEDLVQWLARDNDFPTGAFLMTGTGIVPTSEFTLNPDDMIHITIDGIGTLSNPVIQN
ncbi:Fumarylacetoacetate (FAA) hydrolase family protein [Stieleria bergensis]|uniref:Fumarylacetoacetate (FAA) hydrolase family protein n=1 Tax=Stieleria bergensis TaxID=2528025 RepID=A0A517SU70_9BACT|nr:MAG: 2-hydroxyhepta-2,4-diene-1,7-dioate isomerase [Rhodopirellula sp. TMED11]QDT59667.1 Fumarylacetoacetate (FAA) hydrolase family protein [Planctomycetes bacterium SV_7m_r]